jgi:hypothetical protein
MCREFEKIQGPKRKVPLLLDENLEAEFVRDLLTVKDFRVAVGTPGTSDDTLWDEARRSKAILVTSDMDFWDDRRFPIAQSPGVIIVAGRSADDKMYSFALAVVSWGIIKHWRILPFWLGASSSRVQEKESSASTGMEVRSSRYDLCNSCIICPACRFESSASAPLLGHGSFGERGVPHPVSCQQGVSNKTMRAHARPYGEAPDGPADLVRRGVGGGPVRSCLPV